MDINGGQNTQTNGNPIWPATTVTGPLTAGNVLHSDGSGNLAGFGEQSGVANVGYALMAQTGIVKQTANTTSTVVTIPAQSQITGIQMMVTTAWSAGNTTFGVGSSGNATLFTGAGAASGATLGIVTMSPGTLASAIANWDNVGNTDVQVTVTSGNTTGAGVGTLTVFYLQGIFNAS